jgi:protein involved in polysaccharide export with SLBB domain
MSLLAFALSGCLSGGAGTTGLFPDGYRLTESAKQIRQTTPPPLELPRELDKQVSGPYIVEPGDVLLVQAASLDSPVRLPGDQPILPDGTIQLGQYGRYQAAGKPMEVIEAEVNNLIRRQTEDAGPILVRLVARESQVFYVVGEVNAPGSYPLRGRETVLDALMAAGGLNSNANKCKIILSRPTAPDSCRVVLPVYFNDIVQLGDTTTNYQIRAGDRIYVPSRQISEELFSFFRRKKEEERLQIGCSMMVPAPIKAMPMPPPPPTPLAPELPNPAPANTALPRASTPSQVQSVTFQRPRAQVLAEQSNLNLPPPPLSLPPIDGHRQIP